MIFSSIPFLYYFLPVVLILYFLSPDRFKNTVLLISSIFFYAWGEPVNVVIMLISILACYGFGLKIEQYRGERKSKSFCILSVAVSLSFLFYFKYTDFFLSNLNAVTGAEIPLPNIALPIGISFYTFQIISYTVDVYRGIPAQKHLADLAAYVTMFPQLIAGPIVRYSEIRTELKERKHSVESAAEGIRRFVSGLAKKILLANQLGEFCAIFKASGEKSVLFYWLYAIAFSLHVYFDFSGYSDMAIGLGKIFGFHFPENFRYPFISESITEFWRRWHISLGSWFRDYVYIPLGGNRKGAGRHLFNIFVVWMLTGFWHGASWNFVIWGLYFAILLVIEKRYLGGFLKKHRIAAHLYTLFFLLISFVIFDSESPLAAALTIGGLFGAGGIPAITAETIYYAESFGVILCISMIGAVPAAGKIAARIRQNEKGKSFLNLLEPLFLAGLMILMTAYLVDGSFNPFLYFRF